MSEQPFVHLHVHTEYSLLDGLSRIDDLVARAKALDMPAVAITDHGAMFGVIDFFRACQKEGVKPIIGMEGYLAPRTMYDKDAREDKKAFHLLLLARNQTGYLNLLKIASAAQLEGYYYRPRIDREFLQNHAEGLIATSGCLAAQIPSMIIEGRDDEARGLVGWYREVFGPENFFFELQQHDIPELVTLNKWLIENCGYANVPLIATNDVHYVRKEDADPHDTLLCIQTSTLKDEPNRMRMSDDSYYLTTQQEMWSYFHEVPQALTNTLLVAEMCEVDLDSKGYHLPIFPVPGGFSADTYLRHLCEKGLRWRYGDDALTNEGLQKRLSYELEVIHSMGFDTYFLIVWDLCQYARHADIWWNVRGSGAGSLTAYCLGITNIDPIQNNLLFERFLNPGRVTMPDIDIDYPDDRRGEMISYAARKYGEDKVAAIITFGTMGAKAAVRDVGRALGVPLEEVNKAAALIPTEAKQKKIEEYVNGNPDLLRLYNDNQNIRTIINVAKELQGVNRHASTHAAGVIVADRPLVDYMPLHRITGTDPSGGALKAVTQFPMETCESIGLLKIDFLGLSTLTIFRKACELIEKHRGIKYTMDNVPYRPGDNPEHNRMLKETFEMIGRGETVGIFQIESTGMQQMLRDMRPTKFEHIVAAVSLYRPGPMEFIPTFNRRLRGEEQPDYKHPLLEPILSETYAIIVYQEQIMQIASNLFGYELGEADLMRRAVSKKKEKDLLNHKSIFQERGPEHGVDVETATKIFDEIEFFANYGFNKCVTYNTEIIDADTGRMIRIGDLAAGKAQVSHTVTCDTDTLKLKPGKITAVMENGVKPVYRLTTQLGRQIDATANHPFLTLDGWRMLGALQQGDQIATPRRIAVEGNGENADWGEIYSLTWDDIKACIDSPNGYIHEYIFELPNQQLEEFITTLWMKDGDGRIDKNNKYCYYQAHSQRVVHQLQHLLLRLGIISQRQQESNNLIVEGDENLALLLKILHRRSVGFYIGSINFDQLLQLRSIISDPWIEASRRCTDDIYWDKVVSIEYLGEEMTYDLTIEDTHNFVANDIIVHNSHAADYAVITCQTAFLKAHYREEYMTALLTVYYDDKDKVTTFLAECKRLGVPILPPDVNYSQLDFDIQTQADGKRGIRFGMAAIKNAGTAALQHIIDVRNEGGIFTSLEDFCQRVDLRIVQKRALESLIKVGALDAFGERGQLAEALDRIMHYSADHHKSKEVGQMSMFGGAGGGISDSIQLPSTEPKGQKEILGWEKELLGFYVTSHPLDALMAQVGGAGNFTTTYDIKDPEANFHDRSVKIVGVVSTTRKLTTKNNDMMCVVQMEDLYGTIDVVLFPRTWQKFQDLIKEGDALVFTGKVDTKRGDAQIICEAVDKNINVMLAESTPPFSQMQSSVPYWAEEKRDYDEETGEVAEPEPVPEPELVEAVAPATQGAVAGTMPSIEPQLTMPVAKPNGRGGGSPWTETAWAGRYWLLVYLQRSDNAERDRRRLRRLHHILNSYPGKDRYTIVIEEEAGPVKMEFPNHATDCCDSLIHDLLAVVGEGNIDVYDREDSGE